MYSEEIINSRQINMANTTSPPHTGMLLGFQQLKKRIIATTLCTTTQPVHVPSIIDNVGCDITIDDIQSGNKNC